MHQKSCPPTNPSSPSLHQQQILHPRPLPPATLLTPPTRPTKKKSSSRNRQLRRRRHGQSLQVKARLPRTIAMLGRGRRGSTPGPKIRQSPNCFSPPSSLSPRPRPRRKRRRCPNQDSRRSKRIRTPNTQGNTFLHFPLSLRPLLPPRQRLHIRRNLHPTLPHPTTRHPSPHLPSSPRSTLFPRLRISLRYPKRTSHRVVNQSRRIRRPRNAKGRRARRSRNSSTAICQTSSRRRVRGQICHRVSW